VAYQQFEAIAMPLMIFALVAFMGYIVWDLAKKSKAGRFGTAILFFGLGLGVLGFVIKAVVIGQLGG
jgi:4-amino-4-deoxy-L-arabinose transferase-like glycosyltransferase|tara:strand:- start:16743 stop:16943 length:201 start_codon:yes stop_codon:yes gene_type:complete